MDADRCVICGEIVPEGRMVCPICENYPVGVHTIAHEPELRTKGNKLIEYIAALIKSIKRAALQMADFLSKIIPFFEIRKRRPGKHIRTISITHVIIIIVKPVWETAKAVFRPG